MTYEAVRMHMINKLWWLVKLLVLYAYDLSILWQPEKEEEEEDPASVS